MSKSENIRDLDIAIIGMSCRFPQANNIQEFWHNLSQGVESIVKFSDQEIEIDNPTLVNDRNYVKAGAVLENIDLFDADFFNYNPKEAVIIDPQQRIFLECAWEALENAGYSSENLSDLIGVYGGCSLSTYLINNVCPNLGLSNQHPFLSHRLFQRASDLYLEQGNGGDHLPMRVSYKLGLTGPSINVQTTCSTALVAVHLATQGLYAGDCDLAIAGGASIFVPHRTGYLYQENMILSPDAHCRAFDAQAQGTVFGNGAGVVVLKLLSKAIADKDHIYGVIKGSAINNDGSLKVGYTAPSVTGQADVIAEAIAVAEIEANTIDYVETHGTGTQLGDPIEIEALTQAFRQTTPNKGFCGIGSVKTNIGHLDEAAGIAGLIKTVLALKNKQIPPSLHFENPNPHIDFDNSPFYVNTQLQEWSTDDTPRRAGVSAFGFGGTNSHVILEEAPQLPREKSDVDRPCHLLTLSAKTKPALSALVARYIKYFDEHPHQPLADICFTSNQGRKHLQHRLAFVSKSEENLRSQLLDYQNQENSPIKTTNNQKSPKIAFLFTGQGSQYQGMARELYTTEAHFRDTLNYCANILDQYLEKPLLEILYPPDTNDSDSLIDQTAYTQPALFAIEYSLYQLWKSWGIEPTVVMGHSVGEYVAACIAGVFSLEDGLKLIAQRGKLMQELPAKGAMAVVRMGELEVIKIIESYQSKVAIAAINTPENTVISGEQEAIEEICTFLNNQGIKTKLLNVSQGFHSPLMNPILAEFEEFAQQISFSPPQINLISNVTGELVTEAITTPKYWSDHIRYSVRFASSMATLESLGIDVFLEIGSRPILIGMGRDCYSYKKDTSEQELWLPSLRPEVEDWQQMLTSLGQLYCRGININWKAFDESFNRYRVPLPTYPFQRKRYWMEAPKNNNYYNSVSALRSSQNTQLTPLIGQLLSLPDTKEIHFHHQISVNYPTWLGDHQVFDSVVMPGTGYLEIALEGAYHLKKHLKKEEINYQLSEIIFHQALVFAKNGEEKTIQLVLSPDSNLEYSFKIFSLDSSTQDWLLHATGKLERFKGAIALETNSQSPELSIDLEQLQDQYTKIIPIEDLYRKFASQNINYGSSFHVVKRGWYSSTDALGEIILPSSLSVDNYQLHPILLDACLQVLDAVLLDSNLKDTYVPVSLDHLQVFGIPTASMWCHANLHPYEGEKPRNIVADLFLYNQRGELIASLANMKLTLTQRQQMISQKQESWKNWLYELVWKNQSIELEKDTINLIDNEDKYKNNSGKITEVNDQNQTVNHSASKQELTVNWLILADNSGIATELSKQLKQQGHQCILVFPSQEYAQIEDQSYTVNPEIPEHFEQLIKEIDTVNQIIHCWSLDQSELLTAKNATISTLESCGSTLHLLQAISKHNLALGKLYLITRGSQNVGTTRVQQLASSTLWGLGKVIPLENPDLQVIKLDLDPQPEANNLPQLLQEILPSPSQHTAREDMIAFRSGNRYVARLERYQHNQTIKKKNKLEIPQQQPYKLVIPQRGSLDNLQLQPSKRQPPKNTEIEIEVKATGLNFIDVLNTLGLYPDTPPLGIECCGKVVAKGNEVTDIAIGDSVIAIAKGSFSQYVTVDANLAILKPEHLTDTEAVTIPEAFFTAYWSLYHLGKISQGDRVLIHAAAGGVGQAAIQLAQLAGAEVYATASVGKWKVLEDLGVKQIMNSRNLDFASQIMEKTQGKGVNLVLNSITNEGFIEKNLQVLAQGGRFLELAKRDIWSPEDVKQTRGDVSYFVIDTEQTCQEQSSLVQEMLQKLRQEFCQKRLKPINQTIFPLEDAVSGFRYMQQAKHTGKIVITWSLAGKTDDSVKISPDGSYLITGGLGDLGLLVARWLAEKGAKNLILLSRSGDKTEVKSQIQALEATGTNIKLVKADVSQISELEPIFKNLTAPFLPLRGIIHTAGVLDDGLIKDQTWQRFQKVLAPKVQGTWNLHRLSLNYPLDFFVLFSSSACLLGAPGQGNYTAANAFLDAIASYRQGQGLPALSINWGPWAEVGMTARMGLEERLSQKGEDSIPPSLGLVVLEKLLLEKHPRAKNTFLRTNSFLK